MGQGFRLRPDGGLQSHRTKPQSTTGTPPEPLAKKGEKAKKKQTLEEPGGREEEAEGEGEAKEGARKRDGGAEGASEEEATGAARAEEKEAATAYA